jgi:hypothetical protein
MPAGFHAHVHLPTLLLQLAVELLGLLTMRQTPFAQFSRVSFDASDLLEARMIITTYDQRVRLRSPEPFGWFAPPKFTPAWAPTLFMESLCSLSLPGELLCT